MKNQIKAIPPNVLPLPKHIVKAIKNEKNIVFPGDRIYQDIRKNAGTGIFSNIPAYYNICFFRFYSEHSYNLVTHHKDQILNAPEGAQVFVKAAIDNMYTIVNAESQFRGKDVTSYVIGVAKKLFDGLKREDQPILTIAAANAIADLWEHTHIEQKLAILHMHDNLGLVIKKALERKFARAGLI